MSIGFVHPFTMVLAGPTQSGKTCFVEKLLKCPQYYIIPPPERIVWAYGIKNEAQMDKLQKASPLPIEFIDYLPDVNEFSISQNNLLVIDDMMSEAAQNRKISDLFTKGCHHRNISIIFITQNLFHQGKHMRDIHTNTTYTVLFGNLRDSSFLNTLTQHSFGKEHGSLLRSAYRDSCSRPYGYLLIDFHPTTPQAYRFTSGIFPPDIPKTYNNV